MVVPICVMYRGYLQCFFFFQAEDGIRDGHVTGVQTCALPIYEAMAFYFKNQQVHIYHQTFSIIDDEQNEVTTELFYKDIMAILTTSTTTMYYNDSRKRDEFFQLDAIKLSTLGSINVECVVQDLDKVRTQVRRMKSFIRQTMSD